MSMLCHAVLWRKVCLECALVSLGRIMVFGCALLSWGAGSRSAWAYWSLGNHDKTMLLTVKKWNLQSSGFKFEAEERKEQKWAIMTIKWEGKVLQTFLNKKFHYPSWSCIMQRNTYVTSHKKMSKLVDPYCWLPKNKFIVKFTFFPFVMPNRHHCVLKSYKCFCQFAGD